MALSVDLLLAAAKQVNVPLPKLRERHLGNADNGVAGHALIQALKKYLNAILREVATALRHRSRYFWLRNWRDLRMFLEAGRLTDAQSHAQQFSSQDIMGDCLFILWLDHRVTLAILKFGAADSAVDMQELPPNVVGASGRFSPIELTITDAAALHLVTGLMWEFEQVRYMLKRAGKGGKLVWTDRVNYRFDVQLLQETQALVDSLDARGGGNLLSGYGSWAPIRLAYDFPLPDMTPSYTPIPPWPESASIPIPFGMKVDDSLAVLTLVPNVAGRECVWVDMGTGKPMVLPPPWLFCWIGLERALPRLRLVQETWRSSLELAGRPGYHPEDFTFALSAIIRYQRRRIERTNPRQWQQIFTRGYNVWTEARSQVEAYVLPEFSSLRERFGTTSAPSDRELLDAVISDLSWDEDSYRDIDILRLRPLKFIFRIMPDVWLFDWSLVRQCIVKSITAFGATWGREATLKGKEFEEALGDYFSRHAHEFSAEVVWRGRGARTRLRPPRGASRDVDLALRIDDCLLLIEIKSHHANSDLIFVGDPDELDKRWETIRLDLDQIDVTARVLAAAPKGKNYSIPSAVKYIIALVCAPHPEWIASSDPRYWLYDDLPRVCTPEELMEVVTRLGERSLPSSNKIPVQ